MTNMKRVAIIIDNDKRFMNVGDNDINGLLIPPGSTSKLK